MASLRSDTNHARQLLNALAATLTKFPKAFSGSGRKLRNGKRPLTSINIKTNAKKTGRNDKRVKKDENTLNKSRTKRDRELVSQLNRYRVTREWLQLNYPNKDGPVRKFFEKQLNRK